MAASLDHSASIQYENEIGVHHGGHSVADNKRSAPLHHVCEVVENARLGVGVHSAQGVIEDENPRVACHGTGQCGALLLPAREVDPALAQKCPPALWEALDRHVELGDAGCFEHNFVRVLILCARFLGTEVETNSEPEPDVLLDGRRKEERVLGHHADERA